MSRVLKVNSLASIASAVALGTLGTLSFIVQPALVQGYVTHLRMTEPQAVNLAGVEMLGVALVTILLALPKLVVDWRRALAGGLAVAVVGNLASAALATSPWFWAARLVAGVGHGTMISLSFIFVGLTARVERNLSIYLVSLLTYGAFGIWAMPDLLDAIGIPGLFLAFAVLAATGFGTLRFVPRSAESREVPSPTARQLDRGQLLTALSGVLAYNIAQGMAWSMLFLIGIDAGIPEPRVAYGLFVSQVFAILGAVGGVVLAERIGRGTAIAIGILGGAACIALVIGRPGFALFLFAICGFNVLWNFVLPFILATVGDFDAHGRMIAPAIAMQMVGLSVGPLLAAQLIGAASFRAAEAACVGFFLFSFVLLNIPMRRHRRLLEG